MPGFVAMLAPLALTIAEPDPTADGDARAGEANPTVAAAIAEAADRATVSFFIFSSPFKSCGAPTRSSGSFSYLHFGVILHV
ncbi:MAG TPA: hypothetical protein VGO30_19920 [Mycobacterium sp.]|nr:hypothetical protein [Mycobacterium sp.]